MTKAWDPRADILAEPARRRPGPAADYQDVAAVPGMTLAHRASRFGGVLVRVERDAVEIRRHDGATRVFRATPGAFEIGGRAVTLVRPARAPAGPRVPADMYLHTLAQYLAYFPDRPATESEAPPASTAPRAWPQLVDVAGRGAKLALGAAVLINLPGGGPLAGVVDYLTPTCVGVRTADALVRFHSRASIGLTVAVSHHGYGEGFDAPATSTAWQSWLDATYSSP